MVDLPHFRWYLIWNGQSGDGKTEIVRRSPRQDRALRTPSRSLAGWYSCGSQNLAASKMKSFAEEQCQSVNIHANALGTAEHCPLMHSNID